VKLKYRVTAELNYDLEGGTTRQVSKMTWGEGRVSWVRGRTGRVCRGRRRALSESCKLKVRYLSISVEYFDEIDYKSLKTVSSLDEGNRYVVQHLIRGGVGLPSTFQEHDPD